MLKITRRASAVSQHGTLAARNLGPGYRVIRAVMALVLVLGMFATASIALAAKPDIDPSYANGQVYYMIGPHIITNPNPNLVQKAEELYIVGYPVPDETTPPLVLASGYSPQCDPCAHGGPGFYFHDHVLSGAPGLGNNGTAGDFKGPWQIILVRYNASVLTDPNFVPVKSQAQLDAAEVPGGLFQVINPGADNPYEIETGAVLICPFVAPSA